MFYGVETLGNWILFSITEVPGCMYFYGRCHAMFEYSQKYKALKQWGDSCINFLLCRNIVFQVVFLMSLCSVIFSVSEFRLDNEIIIIIIMHCLVSDLYYTISDWHWGHFGNCSLEVWFILPDAEGRGQYFPNWGETISNSDWLHQSLFVLLYVIAIWKRYEFVNNTTNNSMTSLTHAV